MIMICTLKTIMLHLPQNDVPQAPVKEHFPTYVIKMTKNNGPYRALESEGVKRFIAHSGRVQSHLLLRSDL